MKQNPEYIIDDKPFCDRLHDFCAFTSRDMGATIADQFVYAIACGWTGDDEDDTNSSNKIMKSFGWSDADIEFVLGLRRQFVEYQMMFTISDVTREEMSILTREGFEYSVISCKHHTYKCYSHLKEDLFVIKIAGNDKAYFDMALNAIRRT